MLLQVYRDNVMKKTVVYEWVTCFSEGRESVTDEERSGQPAIRTEENTAKVHRTVCENCQLTVRNKEDQVNINRETGVCKKTTMHLLTWQCLRGNC
jgi:hypothetical protein